jgi:hypothetical protein
MADINVSTGEVESILVQVTSGPPGAQGPQGIQGPRGLTGLTGAQGPVGPVGPQGIQGIQGIQGFAGNTGLTGDTGPQGIQGIQGIQGVQGATGAKGDTGNTGSQGPQGIQGITGDTGAKGDKGDTGLTGPTGATGSQGIQGVKGDTGSQGAAGVGIQLLGEVATVGDLPTTHAQGDAYIVTADGNLHIWNGTFWTDAGQIVGPQGPTGPTGAQGIQGVKGDTGNTGATGSTGATGPQGIQGITGDTGAQGPQGIQGATGSQGIQGIQGSQGIQGVQGARGFDSITHFQTGVGYSYPASDTIGNQYDFFLDGVTGILYGPKTYDETPLTPYGDYTTEPVVFIGTAPYPGCHTCSVGDKVQFIVVPRTIADYAAYGQDYTAYGPNDNVVACLFNGVFYSGGALNWGVSYALTGMPDDSQFYIEYSFTVDGLPLYIDVAMPYGHARSLVDNPTSTGLSGVLTVVNYPSTVDTFSIDLRTTYGLSYHWNSIALIGATGSTGATGATGPQGPAGDTGATGAAGTNGTNGATGATGPGVAAGGTAGQILAKIDSTDYNTQWTTLNALPSQTGNSGLYLTTNGSSATWAAVVSLPTQTGNTGKYLTTNGSTASWSALTVPPAFSDPVSTILYGFM